MNYYQHHIGDFNNATRHLTRVERSIYSDMLDLYYDTEKPLTLDFDLLCRKVIARTDEERTAVQQALNEFFIKTDSGWYQERCELVIADYHANTGQKAAAGRASAAKRAAKRQQAINGNPTGVEQALNERATNQEPVTNNQEPSLNTLSGKPDANPLREKNQEARESAKRVLNFLNEKTGRAYRPTPAIVDMIAARIKDGATETECRQIIVRKGRDWSADEKMSQYLRPKTLFSRTNFENYLGELVA